MRVGDRVCARKSFVCAKTYQSYAPGEEFTLPPHGKEWPRIGLVEPVPEEKKPGLLAAFLGRGRGDQETGRPGDKETPDGPDEAEVTPPPFVAPGAGIDMKDFGAIGDGGGLRDDTPAVDAAIQAADALEEDTARVQSYLREMGGDLSDADVASILKEEFRVQSTDEPKAPVGVALPRRPGRPRKR